MSALFAMCAPAAMADESAMPTTQAQAYNADWVPYLDPPEKPAAVCLVDSGVNITPDTPADSPTGPIVKRLALDGGSGEAASPTWEGLHGTRMAFVGAAPVNGWGAVGFWPGARIVSIRAMPTGSTDFPFESYSRALTLCTKYAADLNIAAVNLSLGCECQPTSGELARLNDRVVGAHSNSESVVAAAGNNAGPVDSPANEPGVLAVGAGDKTGGLCSFSNRGPGIDVVAPGCDIDFADSSSGELWRDYRSGTSGGSMTVSTVLALVRSYRPDLDWYGAEQMVANSARVTAVGAVLNVEALFRDAGLESFVDAAKARMPVPLTPNGQVMPGEPDPRDGVPRDGPSDSESALSLRVLGLARPSVPRIGSLTRRGRRLVVSVTNLPLGGRLNIRAQVRRTEFGYVTAAREVERASRITLRLPRRWPGGRLAMRYEFPKGSPRVSSWAYREVPR